MRLPGVGGSRRIMNEKGEMQDVAGNKPWDPKYTQRVAEVKSTFRTALMDTRFRIGHVARQLMAQGKHLTMNSAEHKAVEESIAATADAFEAVASALEKLRVVAQSEVWVSKDVSKLAQNMAAFVHAAADLDAARELKKEETDNACATLTQCATVLRHSGNVLKLIREVSGIELGVNNLGLDAAEFRLLAGVTHTPDAPRPRPEELPGFLANVGIPVPTTEEESTQLRLFQEERRLKQEEQEKDQFENLLLKTQVRQWVEDGKKAGGGDDFVPVVDPETIKKCSACGLDDPPRGDGILPVVDMRDTGTVLCLTCWQQARSKQLGHDRE